MNDTTTPIVADLCERLHVLWLRYNVVFREPTPANPPYIPMAEKLMCGLLDADHAAMVVTRSLVDQAEQDRPEFWGTSLGRLLFMAGGYPHETVTQTAAAGLLGCSRQWVNAMVTEGKLTPCDDRSVVTEEVRSVLKRRADRLLNPRS